MSLEPKLTRGHLWTLETCLSKFGQSWSSLVKSRKVPFCRIVCSLDDAGHMNIDDKLDLILKELLSIKSLLVSQENSALNQQKGCTVKEAAAYLRLSVARVYELVYAGKLIPLQAKKYHRLLFSFESLNNYLHDRK